MDNSSRKHRNRPANRATGATRPPTSVPSDQAVADAEGIVVEAWVQVLLGHRDQAQSALQDIAVCCDAARRTLAAALLDRAPGGIADAHTDLEAALTSQRVAVRAHEQANRALEAELDRLTWRSMERKVEACIAGTGESSTSATPAGPAGASQPPASLSQRLSRRSVSWILHLTTRFSSGGWLS